MDRRQWIKQTAMAALGAGVGGCFGRESPHRWPAPPPRQLARVKVGPERIIRTVVGLRPFRPSGFVVKSEMLGSKTLIHNYGHGGGGVTLSWGTAHLATELAQATGHKLAAVLGCGAVGLASARLLQRGGVEVTIYARELPPHTTSNMAGAQWSPFSVVDHDRQTPAFMLQFARAARLSHRYFQDLVGPYYGVRWIENYELSQHPFSDSEGEGAIRALTPELFPEWKLLGPEDHPFKNRHARRFVTMLIEPPIYLNALLRDFLLAGGKLVVREFGDAGELASLREPVIVNCTGLGAKKLFGDDELTPIKGQLTILLPQPEVDYAVLDGQLYMFPRQDGILLGGTFERGVWELEPNQQAARRILAAHMQLFHAP